MFKLKTFRTLGYKKENGLWIIEVKLEKIEQLFDKKDPSPFRVKDLEESVADYILTSAEELGAKRVGKLRILYGDPTTPNTKLIKTSINNFFNYQYEISKRDIYKTLGIGLKSLFIGIICMLISLSIIFTFEDVEGLHAKFISEGALLLAWVSMWKPFNLFLYEWWPLRDDMIIYKRLASVEVDILSANN